MNIILWLLFGALAGWIASMITGTNAEQGAIGNVLVGIVGAFLGGFIMTVIGGKGISGFNFYSLLVAIGGAVVVLFLWKRLALR